MPYIKDNEFKISLVNDDEYKTIVKDILENSSFKKLQNIEHHGISRWEHLTKISYRSYIIAKRLKMDYKSVARGGLLHDFYLDGDERNAKKKFLDTFIHPKKALETSINTFELNDIEKNIIISHMFPIYPALPKYKESVLVDIVDKIIGSYEMAREYKYKLNYKFNYLYLCLVFSITSK